jgi:hypothetical protein
VFSVLLRKIKSINPTSLRLRFRLRRRFFSLFYDPPPLLRILSLTLASTEAWRLSFEFRCWRGS